MLDIHSHRRLGAEVIRNLSPEEYPEFRKNNPTQRVSVGIHPWDIDGSWTERLEQLSRQLSDELVLAVGECGLDKKCSVNFSLQQLVFERHIEISEQFSKPMIIHCVKAYNELIAFKKRFSPAQKWILHGFRGKPLLAQQMLDNGLLLSIGYSFNPETVKTLPADSFFLETDDMDLPIELIAERVQMLRKEERCLIHFI